MTFHTLSTIIAGATSVVALAFMLGLLARHALRLSVPAQQLKIMRIALLVPVTAAVNVLGVALPQTYFYLKPWAEFTQSLALANFFLLMMEYAAPPELDAAAGAGAAASLRRRRDLFAIACRDVPEFQGMHVEKPTKSQRRRQDRRHRHSDGSPAPPATISGTQLLAKRWVFVFQYPAVSLLIAVLIDATNAANVYCEGSGSAHFAHIWLKVAAGVSAGFAIAAVLATYKQLKAGPLVGTRALPKLLAFKIMIGVSFLVMVSGGALRGVFGWDNNSSANGASFSQIILTILHSIDPSPLEASSTLSKADAYVGIPALVNCCILVPVSLLFHYAYHVQPYRVGANGGGSSSSSSSGGAAGNGGVASTNDDESLISSASVRKAGPVAYHGGLLGLAALAAMLDPSELVANMALALRLLTSGPPPHASAGEDYSAHHGTGSPYVPEAGYAGSGGYGPEMAYAPAHMPEYRYDPGPSGVSPAAAAAATTTHYGGGYSELPPYGR
jgi:hypothetical protein